MSPWKLQHVVCSVFNARSWTTTCAAVPLLLMMTFLPSSSIGLINMSALNKDYLPSVITDDSGQKANLSEWKTEVHLLFCQGTTAEVYFRTPPILSRVHLIKLEVRLEALTHPDRNYYAKLITLPASPQSVDNVTGLVRVDFNNFKFYCTHNCWGYVAEVRGMSFNDYYTCLDCQTSTTEPHCIYYPNGTVSPTKHGEIKNCTSLVSDSLREQLLKRSQNCQPTKQTNTTADTCSLPCITATAVAASLGFIILFLAASCGISLLYSILKYRLDKKKLGERRLCCTRDKIGDGIISARNRLLDSECTGSCDFVIHV